MLAFTSVFGAILAASFGFLGNQNLDAVSKVLLSFAMIILSTLGFLYMHILRIPWIIYSRLADAILVEFNLEKYRRFGAYRKDKLASAKIVFYYFYITVTALYYGILMGYLPLACPDIFSRFPQTNIPTLFWALLVFVIVILLMSWIYKSRFERSEKGTIEELKQKFPKIFEKS